MSEKYAFIAAQYAEHQAADTAAEAPTIEQMTRWLNVSKSGFYEWRARGPSDAERRREERRVARRDFTSRLPRNGA